MCFIRNRPASGLKVGCRVAGRDNHAGGRNPAACGPDRDPGSGPVPRVARLRSKMRAPCCDARVAGGQGTRDTDRTARCRCELMAPAPSTPVADSNFARRHPRRTERLRVFAVRIPGATADGGVARGGVVNRLPLVDRDAKPTERSDQVASGARAELPDSVGPGAAVSLLQRTERLVGFLHQQRSACRGASTSNAAGFNAGRPGLRLRQTGARSLRR